MLDIVKIILYAIFAIFLTIATAAVVFIAWIFVLTSPILIPAIVILAIIGTMIEYLIAGRK